MCSTQKEPLVEDSREYPEDFVSGGMLEPVRKKEMDA